MGYLDSKNFSRPDEVRTLPKTRVEVVKIGDHTIMRTIFDPGWKWSECVKPTVGTPSCQVHHIVYTVSGKMVVRMDDGTQKDIGPGELAVIPPGHDAWVVGNEPCIGIDFVGGATYAKK